LVKRWKTSAKILVVFGAPLRGLYDIAKYEKISLDYIADFVVNTFPVQEVETVRTEEAIPVALGVLRMFTAKG
jgi:predicted SPOUT superfamily RNA methylase MTH1